MTMVVVVEDNVIDGDQSGVNQRFKLSFVVSFHVHQLPNFQGRTLWAVYWTGFVVAFALLMI
jgi:hypothetical protein